MTTTESLSERIAHLERLASEVPRLQAHLADLDALREATHATLAESLHAEHVLGTLQGHAERLFAAGELLSQGAETTLNSTSMPLQFGPIPALSIEPVLTDTDKTPTDTTRTDPGEAANSESNSAPIRVDAPSEPSEPGSSAARPPTNMERLTAWISGLAPAEVITASAAAERLDLLEATVKGLLSRLCKDGLLTRQDGTGKPGVPSVYRQPAAAPATMLEALPTLAARVRALMAQDPERGWQIDNMADALVEDRQSVRKCLANLAHREQLDLVPGLDGPTYYLRGHAPTTAPAGAPSTPTTDTLVPIPAKLNPDEVSLYDTLRHAPDGLSEKLLVSRLNWGMQRVQKAATRLEHAGHLGRNGEKLRVIPAEYQGQQAAV